MISKKRAALYILGGIAGVFVVLVLIASATDWGRRTTADAVLWGAREASGYRVRCARFDGNIFSDFTCTGLTVADKTGEFLSAQSLSVGWRPSALLGETLHVDHVRLAQATMTRIPDSGDDTPFALPHWPGIGIRVGNIAIDAATIRLPDAPAMCFGGGGHVTIVEPSLDVNADFRRCGNEGAVHVAAQYADGRLTVDTHGEDDGAIAALALGWPGAGKTTLAIAGGGPLAALTGTLDVSVENGGAAHFRLAALPPTENGTLGLTADGTITLAEGRAPDWAPARDGALSLRLAVDKNGAARLDDGMLRWGATDARFHIALDERRALSGQIDADLGAFMGAFAFNAGNIALTLGGNVERPSATGTYRLAGINAASVRAEQLQGRVSFDMPEPASPRVVLQGDAQGFRAADAIDALFADGIRYDISGRMAGADNRIALTVALNAAHASLTAQGALPANATTAGNANAKLTTDGQVPIAGVRIPGGLTINAAIPQITTSGAATGVLDIAGPMLAASGRFALGAGGALNANLATARVNDALLSRAMGIAISGAPALRLIASGTLARLTLAADVRAPHIALSGIALSDAHATANAAQTAQAWNVAAALTSESNFGHAALHADIGWGGKTPTTIRLADSSLAGAPLTGNLTATETGGPFTGTLVLHDHPLAPFAALVNPAPAASGTLSVGFAPHGDAQSVTLAADLTHVAAWDALHDATITAHATYELDKSNVAADVAIKDDKNTLHVAASGVVAAESRITMRTIEGHWAGTPFRLLAPFDVQHNDTNLTVAPARLDVSGGRVDASGELRGKILSARLALSAVPVAPFAALWNLDGATGRIDATGDVRLAETATEAHARIDARGLAFSQDARNLQPANVEMTGEWNGRALMISGQITGLEDAPASFDGTLPLLRVAGDYGAHIPEHGPVSGHFTAAARAERLFALLPLSDDILRGALSVSLTVGGDISAPALTGYATLEKGAYENFQFGTKMENLNVKADALPGGALTLAANATDGGDGRFALAGKFALGGGGVPAGEATIDATNAFLLRADEYTARGTAHVTVAKDANAPIHISGKVTTTEVRFDVGKPLPPSVQQIDVIEINRPESLGNASGAKTEMPEMLRTLVLDVGIAMPNRVYVMGYGLDAEWRGNLNVSGTAAAPDIAGALTLVRGDADLLGKTFTLDEGTITPDRFSGGGARIHVTGSYTEQDLEVHMTADGPVAAPKIDWTSTPALPREEILSRLYFGGGSPQLSAGQALQLAQISGALGNFGGTGGVLAFARRITSLDVLRVDAAPTGDAGGPNIAVGKYITNRIYVGAVRGADASSGAAQVDVRVTPHITVEVETGAAAEHAAGVNWKWDY